MPGRLWGVGQGLVLEDNASVICWCAHIHDTGRHCLSSSGAKRHQSLSRCGIVDWLRDARQVSLIQGQTKQSHMHHRPIEKQVHWPGCNSTFRTFESIWRPEGGIR
mgnify:CR=1 FL=1